MTLVDLSPNAISFGAEGLVRLGSGASVEGFAAEMLSEAERIAEESQL